MVPCQTESAQVFRRTATCSYGSAQCGGRGKVLSCLPLCHAEICSGQTGDDAGGEKASAAKEIKSGQAYG